MLFEIKHGFSKRPFNLPKMIPAFIISFNRLTSLQDLCIELDRRGCMPVIVDNGSTYNPLLKWLGRCIYPVHFLDGKMGHLCPWESGIIESYKADSYIVTDNDLDISSVPLDMVKHLANGFDAANVTKVGLSLEINDLPYNGYTADVVQWESKFWNRSAGGYFIADIDTTLALYNNINPTGPLFFKALRADRPYTARHLPWYNVPPLNEEEQYLHDNTNHHGYWKTKFKQHFNV